MKQVFDLEVRRENRLLKKEVAALKRQLDYFVKEWSKAETSEIKTLLDLEDLRRRSA